MDNNQPVGMFYILFSVTLHLKHPHTLLQLSREFVCVIVSVSVYDIYVLYICISFSTVKHLFQGDGDRYQIVIIPRTGKNCTSETENKTHGS